MVKRLKDLVCFAVPAPIVGIVVVPFLLATGAVAEELPTKTIVHSDDLAVIGGLCAGDKCTGWESFTSSTQILKSNNARLLFLDTTTTAGIPSHDWKLVANDNVYGGENRFSIENSTRGRTPFTVLGEAPNHSLYIGDSGEVGFGTSTPDAELHVMAGDTPTLRLEQDSSAGFASYAWDVSGNEVNFFVRDRGGAALPLVVQAGAPTNSLYVKDGGFVGVGTSSPTTQLEVDGTLTVDSVTAGSVAATDFVGETVELGGWQIRVNGGGELEFALAQGGVFLPVLRLNDRGQVDPISVEIAEGDPGTASSEAPGLPAYDAFDLDPGTVWQSQGAGPQWLSVDLGSLHLVDKVTVHWGIEAAETYAVQISEDGLDWSTLYSNIAGDGGTDTFSVDGRGRYVRLWIPSAGAAVFTVVDVEVYGRADWTP